jgi:rhodanese-related sulfurtransferase
MSYGEPPPGWRRCWRTLWLLAAMSTSLAAGGGGEVPDQTEVRSSRTARPYCGLYCLYAALRLAGRDVEFTGLVRPEYVGSATGSSSAELEKAARDFGLYAARVESMSTRVLQSCRCPVVLHVKGDITSDSYDHYSLFLGMKNGRALVFDPPRPPRLTPLTELAPCWDGRGLILSTKPIEVRRIFAPARRRMLVCASVVAAAVWILHLLKRLSLARGNRLRLLRPGRLSLAEGMLLGLAALLSGVAYHGSQAQGLLVNAAGAAMIREAHLADFLHQVGGAKVRRLLAGDTVFIDARFTSDFANGHLPGAISVPVNVSESERHAAVADVPKDAKMVVYCQSAGCRFARTVAVRLQKEGFSNISIYRGGWNDWAARGQSRGDEPAAPSPG